MHNISKNGVAVSSEGNPPKGQINLATSSSSMAEARGERRAQGIKMNPLGKGHRTSLTFLSLFLFKHF